MIQEKLSEYAESVGFAVRPKFSYGDNNDVVSLAFLSQQFPHCCLPCPGGKPGPGSFTVVGTPSDDDGSQSKAQPKAKAGAKKTGCLKKGPAAKKKTSPKGS